MCVGVQEESDEHDVGDADLRQIVTSYYSTSTATETALWRRLSELSTQQESVSMEKVLLRSKEREFVKCATTLRLV